MQLTESEDVSELLRVHFTHRKEMDGASRLKQHDNVHKQLCAFEKLLQQVVGRFSKEKLYQMLKLLTHGIPAIPRAPRMQAKVKDDVHYRLASLRDLREILRGLRDPKRRGIEKEEEAHLLRYFDAFFDDVGCLKDLKRFFDEKIYVCLYDYFYDPTQDAVDLEAALREQRRHHGHVEDENDSGNSSLNGSAEERATADDDNRLDIDEDMEVYFDNLDDAQRLAVVVHKMYKLNQNWDGLLQEDDMIDMSCFDEDSGQDISQFEDYQPFEPILRLLPDLFVKAYKSVEVAKLWWTQANKVYDVLPGKRKSDKDYKLRMQEIERKIAALKDDIRRDEELLFLHSSDLKNLNERETRYKTLSEQCERVEERKNFFGCKYNQTLIKRESLKEDMGSIESGTAKYMQINQEMSELQVKLIEIHSEMGLVSFQFRILQEDFCLELEVRPSLIRFEADVQQKLADLQGAMQQRKGELSEAIKVLAILRADYEKMKSIMQRYLKFDESTAPDARVTRRVNPTRMGPDMGSDSKEENTADRDSGQPSSVPRDATFVTHKSDSEETKQLTATAADDHAQPKVDLEATPDVSPKAKIRTRRNPLLNPGKNSKRPKRSRDPPPGDQPAPPKSRSREISPKKGKGRRSSGEESEVSEDDGNDADTESNPPGTAAANSRQNQDETSLHNV